MLFGFCIPVYNTEEYFADSIESVLNQTLQDFELLIINDGSTDGSLRLAEYYATKDKRIRIITQQNKGLFHARIAAFKNGIESYDKIIFNEKMQEYSLLLKKEPTDYINSRHLALQSRMNDVKQRRNLKWYLKRLNIGTFKMLLSSFKNKREFNGHVVGPVNPKNTYFPPKRYVVICGNFDVVNQNAAGRRVLGEALLFKSIGYTPVLIGISNNAVNSILDTEKHFAGFTSYSCKRSVSVKAWLRCNQTFSSYKQVFNAIDVNNIAMICVYGSPVLSYFVSKLVRYAKKNNIKIVGDCVDWIERNHDNMLRDMAKSVDMNYLKQWLIPKMDGIIVISSYLQRLYTKRTNKPILLLPPVGETYRNYYNKDPIKATDSVIYFIYIGTPFSIISGLSPCYMKDRLDKAIEIVETLRQDGVKIQFDIYGIIKSEYLEVIPQQSELLNRDDCGTIFHGKVSADDAKEALMGADALLLYRDISTVTSAGFPSKVAESLCCGIPVIATDTSDIPKYVINGETGLIIDFDTQKAAHTILNQFIADQKYIDIKNKCRKVSSLDYRVFEESAKRFFDEVSKK